MMSKLSIGAALFAIALFGSPFGALAAPTPNPNGPAHTGTACSSVLGHNPNTTEGGHISEAGGIQFATVGEAFCGL
jgi:hypothetical protein